MIQRAAPFDPREKHGARHWRLGLAVFAMTVANALLWATIWAISHGFLTLDPRFFARL